MGIVEEFKNFYNKMNINVESEHVSLSDYHPQLELIFGLVGVGYKNTFLWRVKVLAPCVMIILVIGIFDIITLSHAVDTQNYALVVELISYIITTCYVFIVFACIFNNGERVMEILSSFGEDFIDIRRMNSKNVSIFWDGQKRIWQSYVAWLIFNNIFFVSYVLFELLLLAWHHFTNRREERDFSLLIPMWLPNVDVNKSPHFELIYLFHLFVIAVHFYGFNFGFVYTAVHLQLHHCVKLDVIKAAIEQLFDNLDVRVMTLPHDDLRLQEVQATLRQRIKFIVDGHNSVLKSIARMSRVYGPIFFYQLFASGLIICCTGFEFLTNLDNARKLCIVVFFSAIFQIFLLCYLGSMVKYKGFELIEACYNNSWESTPLRLLVKQDLVLIMMRSQIPIQIKSPGLPILDLETFRAIMSSTYTYFNILRQNVN